MAALGRAVRALRAGVRGRSAGPPGAVALPLGAETHEEEPMAEAQRKNPDYHGFYADPAADVANMRAAFLAGVSGALVLGAVFVHYLPDYGLQQWARREAERRIREREGRGLPLLDSNYYDPARLALPPPSELGPPHLRDDPPSPVGAPGVSRDLQDPPRISRTPPWTSRTPPTSQDPPQTSRTPPWVSRNPLGPPRPPRPPRTPL